MSTATPNFGLTKPDANEAYDIGVQNANMDRVDAKAAKSDMSNVAPEVLKQAVSNAGALIELVNALTQTAPGKALDASQGKVLSDLIAAAKTQAEQQAQAVQGNLQTHQADETRHVSTASKAAPVDADSIALVDSADGNKVKRVLWSKVKSLFAAATHYHRAADVTSGIFPLSRGGLNADTAAGGRATLDTMKPVWAEVTLPATGWTLSGTVYVQTVACAVAATTMKLPPNVGLKKSTDTAAAALEKEAFALIETVDTADGSITATCGDTAPQVAITLLFAGGVA